ncbi:hypothetical protein DPSP01_005837 [Paraphaeosphaeria sporulosa]
MPVFSNLLWPFQLTATSPEPTHKTSSAYPLTHGTNLAQDRNPRAYLTSATPDNKQAAMEATAGFGGDCDVESVEKEHSVQQNDTAFKFGGVLESGDHEALAFGTTPAGDNGEAGSSASQPSSCLGDGKNFGQALSEGQDEATDPIPCEHGINSALQVEGEGGINDHTTDQPCSNGPDDSYPRVKREVPGDEKITELNRADDKVAKVPNIGNKSRASEQADFTLRQEEAPPSSPLPTHSRRPGEQGNPANPQPEPSSDSVFMQQVNYHFARQNRASGSHPILPKDYPNNLSKGALEYYHESNERQNSQHVHPDLAGSARSSHGLRDMSHKEKLSSGIHDEHSGRLENVHRKGVSHGPTNEGPWNDLQQPRSILRPPSHYPPASRGMLQNMQNRQILSPQFTPSLSYDAYRSIFSPSMLGYQIPDHAMHEQRTSAQSVRKDNHYTQAAAKRKRQEESGEDEEEPEEGDDYFPSESGDEEDSDPDSNSDSDADAPLMYRKKAAETARRKRAGSSHSEYHDEGAEDQDEDQGEDIEDPGKYQQEERDITNEEVSAKRQKDMEPVQHIDIDTRSPTQDSVQDASEPSPSLIIKLELPSIPTAGPAAVQRTLPVLQPEVAPEAPPSDEISFKLPQYHVEVMPLRTKDDYPEVRVNLPGMIRESLLLTPDHAHQEIHLLKHLFMPGQQSLATPDPAPMVALLNFHTIATMVLEAYTAYEVGDLEATTFASSSSNNKKDDTEALDATKDEIFFAVMDRWRVGLAEETLKPSYKLIRGVQEFCDIALDVIYYLEEYGFVDGPQMMRKERGDKGVKKSKDKNGGKKAGAGNGSDEDDVSEGSTPKKRSRSSKAHNDSPLKGKGKTKGEVNALQARKKPKTTPKPKASTKKQPKVKKEPTVSVISRKK